MSTNPADDRESEDSGAEEDAIEYSREELLCLNPFTLRTFSKQKLRYMACFDVEHWSSELKDFTFPTLTAEVDWAEGVAVQHLYQEGVCRHRDKITDEDDSALASLRCKIDVLIAQLKADSIGAPAFFVRMGPRSPKDAPMLACSPPESMPPSRASLCGVSENELRIALQSAAHRLGLQETDTTEGAQGSKADAHEVLHRFSDVCAGLLRVNTALEALRLLASSSRVMQDISHTLDQGRTGWSMSIVARQWDDDVRLEREFRTFVVAGEVTGISQYDDQLMYPFVGTHAEEIVAAIAVCVAAAKPQLQRLSASLGVVVDLLVVPGSEGRPWQARIIELNPFGPMTGSPLFSWNGDRRILQGGKDLYGDLGECEHVTPAGSIPLPPHVSERMISGVPFRYLEKSPVTFGWDQLQVHWEDYVRLAPPAMFQKAG